jgi:hypothetical protein
MTKKLTSNFITPKLIKYPLIKFTVEPALKGQIIIT